MPLPESRGISLSVYLTFTDKRGDVGIAPYILI